MIDKVDRCIACGCIDNYANLVQINVRHKGVVIIQKFVHPACYEKDPSWAQKQVKGKNPKFFVMNKSK